jgi:hypothetical protein
MAIFVATVAVLFPLAISKKHQSSKAFFCDQCGIRMWVNTNEMINSTRSGEQRRMEDTELSRWFATHVGTNCQHTWRLNHFTDRTYVAFARFPLWQISGVSGSLNTPALIYLAEDDRERVEKLLARNREDCRNYIRSRLQGMKELE